MRAVIGEYTSLEAASRAVRALESRLSIQQVVIKPNDAMMFVVRMGGTREAIDQARELLRVAAEHYPEIHLR
ncbi:MAG: hypothetical protein RL701_7800 [Pseudomonadota bacterium]|jgi:hypothetical protein